MESSPEENSIDNKYNILEVKGRGATANVYLVEDKNDKAKYAVKVLKEVSPYFEKEIEILKTVSVLKNPFIVNLINYGKGPVKIKSKPEKNNQYVVLDYASKGEIFDYIYCADKGLSERHAKLVFHKILKGVEAIHNAGICHRDLKMQNILVDDNFNPKICDFGFGAKLMGEDGSGKLTEFLGTQNYAAPEIFLHRPYDGVKVDIFSLGVVLLNLVTCKIGFLQATRLDKYYRCIMAKKYNAYWKLVSGQIGNISEDLKNLYIKMVAFSPEQRPSIDNIYNDPWMKEVTSLDENSYHELEHEVLEEFKIREIDVLNHNETVNAQGSGEVNLGNDRALGDDEVEYFDLSLSPKLIQKTGLNMQNYMKINGDLKPGAFMNALANKIVKDFPDNAKIEEYTNGLKFNVAFEDELEDEEEPDEELAKELEKLGLEDIDEETITKKDCVIQVKLFQSLNGGYLVRFVRKAGEIEDYYKKLDSIISIVKKVA
jgi:serine/threonine protein kinase